jgi:uracil-DNA glycosylase
VPPENKPTAQEIFTCNRFLKAQMAVIPRLSVILALGQVAHAAVLTALGVRRSLYAFRHGARHELENDVLFDSYHCSRYNTNTGRLTPAMFKAVIGAIAELMGESRQ